MKNLVFNLRTAKAQAGCAKVTKSSRMAKILTTLTLLLTLCVGQMWANNTTVTFYYAVDATTAGSNCNDVKYCIKYGGGDGEWTAWTSMTKQDKTQGGKLVYKATYTFPWDGYYNWQFIVGSTVYEWYAGSWNSTLHNGQIYVQGSGWTTYSPDASYTVYYVNANSWTAANVKAYAWNGDGCDKNAAWAGTAMTSTSKKYNGKDIYSITFNKRFAKIIFSNNGSDTGKSNDLTLGTTNAGKMFTHASASTAWVSPQYDVTLDMQSGSGGTSTIIATPGSAKPSIASLPSRTGYTFGGYYTSTGGGGTQYYNASGTATSGNWPAFASSPTTLYAKWTANTYTITYKDQGGGNFSGTQTSAPTSHTYGTATTLKIPTKTGYMFGGWYTSSDCSTGAVGTSSSASLSATGYTANITLYAKWTAITVTSVSFSPSNTGTTDSHSFTMTFTTNVPTDNTYQYAIREFVTSASSYGAGYQIGATNIGAATITTASMNPAVFSSTGTYKTQIVILKSGSEVYSSSDYTYTVASASDPEWSMYNDNTNLGTFTNNGDNTYTLVVTIPAGGYNLTHYNNDQGFVGVTGAESLTTERTLVNNNGRIAWQDGAGTFRITIRKDGSDWKISAVRVYSVTYNGNGKTGGSVPTDDTYYTSGSTVTVKSNSGSLVRTNYSFGGWNTNASGTGTNYTAGSGTFSITADTELFAKWNETMHTVTVSRNSTTLGTVSTSSVSAGVSTASTTITATPVSGATFTGWTIPSGVTLASGTTSSASITINATADSKTITANFSETTYTVNVALSDASQSNGTTNPNGDTQVGAITPVQITAPTPKTGFSSTGRWTTTGGVTVANATANPTTITATAAGTVRWTFDEDLTSTWYVEGDASGPFLGWTANANTMMMKRTGYSTSSDVYWELEVPASKTSPSDNQWEFKIYNDASTTSEKWYGWGNNTDHYWLTKANNNLTLSTTGSNTIYLKCYVEGTYTFHVNYSTPASPTLEVIWPVVNQLRISSANPADAGNTGNYDLVEGSDNDWSVSRNLNAGTTYTFKMVYEGDWYGKNSTNLTRASNSASALSTDGANMTIETDVAGSYTFTFNSSSKNLSVTYPAAYKLTYSIGDVAGTEGSISSSPSTSSGSYVPSGNTVTLTAPAAKTGYTWKGWYTNAAGTEGKIADESRAITVTMNADKTLYACYTQDDYTITLNGNSGTGHTASVTAHYGEFAPVDDGVGGHKFSITNPNRDGYTFAGWYTNTDGTGTMLINPDGYLTWSIDGFTDGTGKWIATSGTTLYARWKTNASVGKYNFQYGSGTWYSSSWTLMNFGDADDHERTIDFTLIDPTSKKFFVGYDGDFQSVRIGEEGTAGASSEENLSNLRLAPGTLSVGSAIGATGKLVIFDNSSEDNLYVGFKPNGYGLTYAGGTKAFSEVSDHLWQTDIVTLTSSDVAGSFKVGLLTATPGSYVDCSTMTATDNAAALNTRKNALVTEQSYPAIPNLAAGQEGRFVIWDNDSHAGQQWYLCFLPVYSITYNDNGASSGSVPVDANKYRTNETPTVLGNSGSLAKEGYAFSGWNTAADGRGTAYTVGSNLEAIGDNVILYAQYRKAEITDVVLNAGIFNPVEAGDPETYVTADPTLDPTPAPTIKLCWELRYSNDNPVTGHDPIYVSGNQVKFLLNGLAAGGYKIHVELRTGSECGAGTLLSSYDKSFSIASDHIVTIQYKSGDFTLKASTNVGGKPLNWSDDITADAIDGYAFSSWTAGDGVTIKDSEGEDKTTSTEATIKIKANYDGTLTANYTKKRMIYFYNTLGWSGVTVYFYKNDTYWGGENQGSGANTGYTFTNTPYSEGKHGDMTQIEGTDIWFLDCEKASVPSNYENVVFTEINQHGCNYFYNNNKVVRRGDYKTSLPMFVPLANQTPEDKNGGTAKYYNKGYWMNYPENTGYTLRIYSSSGASEPTRTIRFPFSNDKKMPLKLDVEFNEAATNYYFNIYREDGTVLSASYGMNTDYHSDVRLNNPSTKISIKTTAPGIYTFTLVYKNTPNLDYYISVDYPISKNDYRILYSDNATWSQGSAHTAGWSHPSDVIRKNTDAEVTKYDTVSFYVSKGAGISVTMKFQYASNIVQAGTITWADVPSGSITIPSSVVTKPGVYNFIIKQVGTAEPEVEKVEPYTGNYYIRTDNAGSTKWDYYRSSDHQMTYTEFSMSDANSFGEKYSHYFAAWCIRGTNIKFCIANDYSSCISDTLSQDVGNPFNNTDLGGTLKSDGAGDPLYDRYSANVRFMYNQETNKISRAYVASSTNAARKFLVLRGNQVIKGEDGSTAINDQSVTNGAILSDKENWIYERILYINPGTRFKLFACYAEATPTEAGAQYFRGAYDSNNFTTDANSVILISGTGGYQKARILYDFKTNRLVCAWLPSDEPIDEPLDIDADVMVIRDHQEAAECITFSGSGSKLTDVKTVYGVMKFNRWTLNNRYRGKGGVEDNNKDHCDSPEDIAEYHGILPAGEQKSVYERSLYFISFPFDVKVSEIFGFGTYGKHWVLEYYDGLNRAKNGYWIDSPANWKYVTPSMAKTYELKAYEGYILCLSLGRMAYDNTEVWPNNISNVELYFPSKTPMTNIQTTNVNISGLNEIAGDPYRCTINREGEDGDRRIKDSYWRCLGVPSYDMYAGTLTSDGSHVINWRTEYDNFPFIYAWNMNDNTLTPQSTNRFSFKPMHAYLAQIGTPIYWTNVSATPASVMARQTEEPTEYNWCLTLNAGEQMIDQTYVRMSTDEHITNEFDFGQDLSKELNAGRSDIYSFIGYERAAANSMQMNTETTTIVPLGLNIEATGEYTFSIPDGTNGIGITLIDEETGIRTSLSALDYTVELAAGDYTERFWIEISPVKGAETGIDPGVDARENGVRKVMIDGLLYIVRDGKMYDATGKRVE